MIRVGFTGTRQGMTPSQERELVLLLTNWLRQYGAVEFHHGQCIGADEQAARIAKTLGCRIVSHPPINRKAMSSFPFDEARPPRLYLDRNHDIVDETNVLVAAPAELTEKLRSGTWATIRYARLQVGPDPIVLFPSQNEVTLDLAIFTRDNDMGLPESETIRHLGSG